MNEPAMPQRGLKYKRLKKSLWTGLAIFVGILIANLYNDVIKSRHTYKPRDYAEIVKSGVLRAVTEYNSISFYVDADSINGFHYALLQAFAKNKGLKIEITPIMNFEERLKGIMEGRFDILANSTATTTDLQDSLLFTHPILVSRQVLVQRKAENEDDTTFIRNHLDLANKTIYAAKGNPVIGRIHNLSNEIGDSIRVKEIEKYGPEQLLALVSNGDIDYAVCDANMAKVLLEDLPNLDTSIDISFSQFYSWGVNKTAFTLLDTLNVWLDKFLKTPDFKKLQEKYLQ